MGRSMGGLVRRDGGSYALIMRLEEGTDIQVGALGRFLFHPGCYLYVGSALNGVSARVRRHLRAGKRIRWHIDYLLEYARTVEVWYSLGAERSECLWARVAGGLPGAGAPVTGFGSSDCCCPSHLFYYSGLPSLELFQAGAGDPGPVLERVLPPDWGAISAPRQRNRPPSAPPGSHIPPRSGRGQP